MIIDNKQLEKVNRKYSILENYKEKETFEDFNKEQLMKIYKYNDKKEEKEVKLEKLKTAITFQENNSLKDIIANSNLNVNDIENKVLLEKKNQKKKIN